VTPVAGVGDTVRRGVAAGAVALVLVAAGIGGAGCAGSDGDDGDAAALRPECEVVDGVVAVWGTRAPDTVVGNAEALGDLAASLLGDLDTALARLGELGAPMDLRNDVAGVRAGLDAYYQEAVAYVAGEPGAVPTQVDPAATEAFAGVLEWSQENCGTPA